jgi:hypothetical protein
MTHPYALTGIPGSRPVKQEEWRIPAVPVLVVESFYSIACHREQGFVPGEFRRSGVAVISQ